MLSWESSKQNIELGMGLEICPMHMPSEKLCPLLTKMLLLNSFCVKLEVVPSGQGHGFWPPPSPDSVISITMSLSQTPILFGPLWHLTLLETSYLSLMEDLS